MNFLVDAHLPPGLCALLRASGHDAVHISELTAQNRTTDTVINELSLQQRRVVVTKDLPRQLLFLMRCGNMAA